MTPILGAVTMTLVTHNSNVKPMALLHFGGRRRHCRRSPRHCLEKHHSGAVSSNWKYVFWRLWIFWCRCCDTADIASMWVPFSAISPPVDNAAEVSFEDRSDVVLALLLRHCRRRQPCVLYDTILVLFGDRKNVVPMMAPLPASFGIIWRCPLRSRNHSSWNGQANTHTTATSLPTQPFHAQLYMAQ